MKLEIEIKNGKKIMLGIEQLKGIFTDDYFIKWLPDGYHNGEVLLRCRLIEE